MWVLNNWIHGNASYSLPNTLNQMNGHAVIMTNITGLLFARNHDDIKWKHFPRYWPFVRGIHRLPVNSPHKGQWRRALIFSLIGAWTNSWVNNHEAGDLRRHRAHYDVIVMMIIISPVSLKLSFISYQKNFHSDIDNFGTKEWYI